jgi:putative sugar O-methyltransferase
MNLKFLFKKNKSYAFRKELRSDSDNGKYVAFIDKALTDNNIFENFKKNKIYQQILEHTSVEQAEKYLKIILEQTPDYKKMWESFAINDLIGGADIHDFKNSCILSPSTLRYVKVASDLQCLFGDDLHNANIVEIGVGYGGQRLILDQLYDFKSYDMFDLPSVLRLVSKYLENHLLQSSYCTKTINQHEGEKKYDLAISNYAFSELPAALQRVYIDKVLKKSKRGYLTMNSGQSDSVFSEGKMSLAEIQTIIPDTRILEEKPHSAQGNYLLVWG